MNMLETDPSLLESKAMLNDNFLAHDIPKSKQLIQHYLKTNESEHCFKFSYGRQVIVRYLILTCFKMKTFKSQN